MFGVGAGAREIMGGSTHTVFAKRWITREPTKCSELEMPVTAEEMDRKSDMCELALFWEAHDTMYAVGNEIKGQLAQGLNVVINVSRTCKQLVTGYAGR
jgi:ribose 1,5-bisphosphokinase PhnN